MRTLKSIFKGNYEILIFIVSLVSTLGSLYYSEVEQLVPCTLCWYQRILMYPLVPLAAASYLSKGSKKLHPMYYLLLSLPGLVLAGYHYLLQKTDIFGEFGTCSAALPCGAEQINYLGFVTIPMMALAGFILISLISALAIYNRD